MPRTAALTFILRFAGILPAAILKHGTPRAASPTFSFVGDAALGVPCFLVFLLSSVLWLLASVLAAALGVPCFLNIKAEIDYIAVLYRVFLAFQPEIALFARRGHGAGFG